MILIDENFDLQAYVTKGVENVVRDALKATLKDPRESAFLLKFAAASKAASKKTPGGRGCGGAHPSLPDRQHHQPVQPALRWLLFPLQQRHCGRCSRQPADGRGVAAYL